MRARRVIIAAVRLEIGTFQGSDSIADLTALLHRAYLRLAEMGFNYTASYQDEATTKWRLESGHGFVALRGDSLVVTITLNPPFAESSNAFYKKSWYFSQFAVKPSLQGLGLGGQMLDFVECETRERGVPELRLDTSEGAHQLIAYYEKRGYQLIDTMQWSGKTYRSVVMRKSL